MNAITDFLIRVTDVVISGLLVLVMLVFLALVYLFGFVMGGVNSVLRLLAWFRNSLYE